MNRQSVIDLYIENINPLRAYAYSVVRNADDADDVVQELAVQIIRALDAQTEIAHPKAFLYRCTRNLAISCLRKRRETPESDELLAAHAKTAPDDYSYSETRMALDKYLSELTPEMKEAFIRHYFEGEPLKSIAKALGIELDALKTRFYRIRKRIPKNVFMTVLMLHSLQFFL